MPRSGSAHRKGGRTQGRRGDLKKEPPRFRQRPGCRPREATGGRTDSGNDGRHRNAVRGAETSGRGWRVAGVGDVQVDSVLQQERRLRAGVTERCFNNEWLLMGGGSRMEEGITTYTETVETYGAGGERIKF